MAHDGEVGDALEGERWPARGEHGGCSIKTTPNPKNKHKAKHI
jgi:hypothetical protein